MNDEHNIVWSIGKSINASKSLPPIHVDCSGWEADLPAEAWSVGKSLNAVVTGPLIHVDCSEWDSGRVAWLELVVSFDEGTPPAGVMTRANRMIQLACETAPELGLTYDASRTRASDTGEVIIALTPANPSGAEARIHEIAHRIQVEANKVPGVKRVVAEPHRAA